MKRFVLIFATVAVLMGSEAWAGKKKDVISKEPGSVTFRVDLDLPKPENLYWAYPGRKNISSILRDKGISREDERVIASSYGNDSLCGFMDNPFFKGMIEAFSNHRPVVLTPDVIWILISQGFAHYINDNSEEMRHLIVEHEDKMSLVVRSSVDILTQPVDWDEIIGKFADQIRDNTLNGIADLMEADFTTTGVTERTVSRATLMEGVKAYFEYIVIYTSCGIPDITLKGTPEDWQKVLDKTLRLREYGLGWWVDDLEPILKEFVNASNGRPDRKFWMNIVKKYRPGDVRGGGCSMETPTKFDGWFLKFLPFDENGRTPDKVTAGHNMLPEMVRTEFKYIKADPATGEQVTTEMELWSGIAGMEQNPETYAFTPKLGWFVRVAKTEEELIEEMKDKSENGFDGLYIKVKQVPEIFRKIDRLDNLHLVFMGKVVIPEWMDKMEIGRFQIEGDMTMDEAKALHGRFPKCRIRTTKNGWLNFDTLQ